MGKSTLYNSSLLHCCQCGFLQNGGHLPPKNKSIAGYVPLIQISHYQAYSNMYKLL